MAENKKLKFSLLGILLFISFHGSTADLMSVSCSEAAGVRYDKEDGKIMRNDDGFSGVKPQFIYSKKTHQKLRSYGLIQKLLALAQNHRLMRQQ